MMTEYVPRFMGHSAVLATILIGLSLLGVSTKLEVLCALDWLHTFGFALGTFELQHNLLGGLCLLVEHRLCLTTKTSLLLVVTSLSLSHQGSLASLVLGDLVWPVLLALAAVGVSCLRNVDHTDRQVGTYLVLLYQKALQKTL